MKIPKNYPVQPKDPSECKEPVTCGTCGLTWDDAIVTSMTPAPAARCPFEYFHGPTMVPALSYNELFNLAREMYEHLEYCGWGDNWERSCVSSEDGGSGLIKRATKVFAP